ncbi:MAG: penicillin-binding transpeptidase domain-containing protein [Acidimicrobiales bacterium]
MLDGGRITVAEELAAEAAPLQLAPEFSAEDRFPAGHFVEEVKQFILTDTRFGATEEERRNLLFGGGLRIYTTIDLDLQALGERVIAEVLPDPVSQPDASLVALDPATGAVLAMVGGRDFFGDSPYAKVNLAMGAGRQAGSTFKPMVLAAALESGTPLSKVYRASPEMTFELQQGSEKWTVRNYGGAGGGSVNLVEATIRSYNTVYAQLMLETGPDAAVAMAHELGVQSPLDPVPSLVLGTENVTVLEMADAYATFANRGLRVPPQFVSLITDANGTVLYRAPQSQTRVLEVETADQINAVLQQVIERGTGTAAQIGRPVAGKTGTAEEYRDAWFVGYTPHLAVAVWVGYAQQRLAMVPPTTPLTVTGGSWPAEIWQRFSSEATAGEAAVEFTAPSTPVRSFIDRPTTTVVDPNATTTTTGAGARPPRRAHRHHARPHRHRPRRHPGRDLDHRRLRSRGGGRHRVRRHRVRERRRCRFGLGLGRGRRRRCRQRDRRRQRTDGRIVAMTAPTTASAAPSAVTPTPACPSAPGRRAVPAVARWQRRAVPPPVAKGEAP